MEAEPASEMLCVLKNFELIDEGRHPRLCNSIAWFQMMDRFLSILTGFSSLKFLFLHILPQIIC
jgi:hypothetical protein